MLLLHGFVLKQTCSFESSLTCRVLIHIYIYIFLLIIT